MRSVSWIDPGQTVAPIFRISSTGGAQPSHPTARHAVGNISNLQLIAIDWGRPDLSLTTHYLVLFFINFAGPDENKGLNFKWFVREPTTVKMRK